MNEKTLGIIGTLGCIVLGIIASLIAWFCGGKELQTPTKEVIRQMFNLELTLTIVGAILFFIPLVGQLICVVLNLVSIIYAIMAFIALNNNKEFKAPSFEFIK